MQKLASLAADKKDALRQIIQVGTSAGGMRPKALPRPKVLPLNELKRLSLF
jgi:hypothetical protein